METVHLDISQITPGMKLAEPITNAGGITLIPAGIRLTPMFLARIKKWNITSLDVLVEETRSESEPPGDPGEPGESAPGPRAGTRAGGEGSGTRLREQEAALTEEQAQFARNVAVEVSRAYVNLRDNPLMMLLRAITIKRLVAAGADAPINILRRGPRDMVPLPEESS